MTDPRSAPAGRRLAYDDAATAAQMTTDCHAVEAALHLPAPSLRFEDFPRERGKPGIEVSEAAARLAAAMHLHLD